MSQNSNFVNFLIQDTNGQPKMVKVVQNISKQPLPMKIKPSPVKLFKIPVIDSNTKNPVYHTLKVTDGTSTPKVVHVPIETIKQLQSSTKESAKEPNEPLQIKLEFQPVADTEHAEIMPKLVPIQKKQIESTSSTSSYQLNTMSHPNKRRQMEEESVPEYTTKRRKHADKVGKGLRHFSMKVCEKVRNKGFTSYNEVADELVAEFTAGIHGSTDNQYDQKNIRRRVYDALNVLMAMNIISKEKKEIRWLGLPTNSVQECNALEQERQSKLDRIQEKRQQLQELILRHISFKNLIERNKEAEDNGLNPSTASAIHLPFIVVNTDEDAVIQCSISSDKTEYMFNFDKTFHINDDVEILKRMGLHFGLDTGKCSIEDIEKAKKMVPKSLENFVEEMGQGIEMDVNDLLADEDLMADEDDEEDADEAAGDDEQDYSDDSSDDIDV